MPKKIISKIASRVESVRTVLLEETLPETLSKVKKAGGTVAEGANKVSKAATETFTSVKENATAAVNSGIKQVSEIEWKQELEKVKAIDLPLFSNVRPIDWTAEHIKFWEQDKAEEAAKLTVDTSRIKELVDAGQDTNVKVTGVTQSEDQLPEDVKAADLIDNWDTEPVPHELVTGSGGSGKTVKKNQYETVNGVSLEDAHEINVGTADELIPVEMPKKVVDEDELVYTSVSEDFDKSPAILITGKPGKGKGYSTRQELLNEVSEVLNGKLEKEENKLSVDDSKAKDSAPAPKKTVKTAEPVVTVLGTGEGEVEPLGTAYKKLVRKVAKQAEKNPDVKLYLSGKTFGIGARGTVEQIDGNDVNVFNAKDIKKLLAKIS